MEIVGYGLVALAIAVAGGCLLLFVAIWMIKMILMMWGSIYGSIL